MPKSELAGDPLAYGGALGDVPEATASRAYKKVKLAHYVQIVLLVVTFFTCCVMAFCISQVR